MAKVEKRPSVIKTLLLSFAAIALCVTLVITGTYSLFTDKTTIGNHLQAGTLEMTLTRTKLVKRYLNEEGKLVTATDAQSKDFTGETQENVFALGEKEKLAPDCKFTADMRISMTEESSVAFGYYVELIVRNANKDNLALRQQLKVTVTSVEYPTKTFSKYLSAAENGVISLGSSTELVGEVVKATTATGEPASQNFTVTVEFVNLDTDGSVNNLSKTQGVSFDIVVYAIQLV
ncbi:MAG: hypothetical protein IJX81_02235 [Clostridia bacterium]|nr:hypothetical protein [Clostridia bacterium]